MVAAMRKFFLIALTLAASVRAELVDGVAAIVNDKIITYSDVREYVQPFLPQMRRNFAGPELAEKINAAQMDAIDTLIERHLILAEFKNKGFNFPDTVIDEQMNDIIANDFGGDRAAFIKTLQAENQTLAKYREQLRERIIIQAMRSRKTQAEIVVSPFKIEEYYKANLAKFNEEAQIKLRMILLKKAKEPATAATDAGAAPTAPPVDARRQMAEEILAKLKAGDSFDSLAKVYSDGKEGSKGGDWGWVYPKELGALGEAAQKLTAGKHSDVVETDIGYYILLVEDTKPAHTKPLAEVRDIIEKELLQDQRAKMHKDWVKQLRAKAYIRLF